MTQPTNWMAMAVFPPKEIDNANYELNHAIFNHGPQMGEIKIFWFEKITDKRERRFFFCRLIDQVNQLKEWNQPRERDNSLHPARPGLSDDEGRKKKEKEAKTTKTDDNKNTNKYCRVPPSQYTRRERGWPCERRRPTTTTMATTAKLGRMLLIYFGQN